MSKTLVAFFSATGTTKKIAEDIAGEEHADVFAITPEKPYTGVQDPTELTRKEADVVKALSNIISCDVDQKTGITTVSVVMDDRLMVKQLADTVCTRLQLYVSDYRTKKAKADYDYYCMLADEAKEEYKKAPSRGS